MFVIRQCASQLLIAAAAALFLPGAESPGQEFVWKDQSGKSAPETEFRKSKNGFGGWLVVTLDGDWRQKWETSPETVPKFTTTETVERGKTIFILIFFSNPKLDGEKNADVTCDLDVTRPDKTSSVHQRDAACFQEEVKGAPGNVYLSNAILKFIGEPKDPPGKWIVRVVLKDNHRNVQLPLRTSFTLK